MYHQCVFIFLDAYECKVILKTDENDKYSVNENTIQSTELFT